MPINVPPIKIRVVTEVDEKEIEKKFIAMKKRLSKIFNEKKIKLPIDIDKKSIKELEGIYAKAKSNKGSNITPSFDSKKVKQDIKKTTSDIRAELKKLKGSLKIEPTVDDGELNDDLKDVRQNISEFNKRINSDEAKSYSDKIAQLERYKKSLNELKKVAIATGDVDVADELTSEMARFSLEVTQAKSELRNFAKTGENNVSVLGKLFNNVGDEIQKSREELVKMGKSTKQLDKLETQIEQVNNDFKSGKLNAQQYAKSLQSIDKSAKNAAKNSASLKKALTSVAGVVAGFAVFSTAKDYILGMDNAMTKLAISTGGTQQELDAFKNSARNLQKDGFGDFNKNIEALALVKRQLKLTGEEAEKTATSALLLEQGFGIGTKEGIDAMDKAMKGFNITQQESSDILVSGLQQSGDASGDFIDTVREYSSQVGEAGGSFQDFVNKVLVAEELGIRNTDQFADLYRESLIRVKDASDKTKDGFAALGLSYEDFAKGFADGSITQEQQLQIIAEKILQVKDPILQNQIAVDLLGTKYEDNGLVAVEALASIQDKLGEVTGATQDAGASVDESLGGKWSSLKGEINPAIDLILGKIVDFGTGIVENTQLFGRSLVKMQDGTGGFSNNLSTGFSILTGKIKNTIKNGWDSIASGMKAKYIVIIRDAKSGFSNLKNDILSVVKLIPEAIGGYLGGLSSRALQWGKNLGGSFARGIRNSIPFLRSSSQAVAQVPVDNLKVKSPTKEGPLAEDQSKWGENLGNTFGDGLSRSLKYVKSSSQKLASIAKNALNNSSTKTTGDSITKIIADGIKEKKAEEKKALNAIAKELKLKADNSTVRAVYDKILQKNKDEAALVAKDLKEKVNTYYKELEESSKEAGKAVDLTNKEMEKGLEALDKLEKKALESVESIKDSLDSLESEEDSKLASRSEKILAERKKLAQDIVKSVGEDSGFTSKNKKLDKINDKLDGELSEGERLRTEEKKSLLLDQIQDKLLRENTLTREQFELKKKILELDREQALINQNVSQETLDQKAEQSGQSDTEKILNDISGKRTELEEIQEINKAILDDEVLNIESITTKKAQEYAKDTYNKKVELEIQNDQLRVQYVRQFQEYKTASDIQLQYTIQNTEILVGEEGKIHSAQSKTIDNLKEIIKLQKEAGYINTDVTGNTNNSTVNTSNTTKQDINVVNNFQSPSAVNSALDLKANTVNPILALK